MDELWDRLLETSVDADETAHQQLWWSRQKDSDEPNLEDSRMSEMQVKTWCVRQHKANEDMQAS